MHRNYQAVSTGVVEQKSRHQIGCSTSGAGFMQKESAGSDCSESDPVICVKDCRRTQFPCSVEFPDYKIWKEKFRHPLRIAIFFVSSLLNSGYACRFSLRKLINHCTCSSSRKKKEGVQNVDVLLNELEIDSKSGKMEKIQLTQYYSSIIAKLNLMNQVDLKGGIIFLFTPQQTDDFWNRMKSKLISKITEFKEDEHFRKCPVHIRLEYSRLFTALSFPKLIKGKQEEWIESLQKILQFDSENIFSLLHLGLFYLNSEGNLEEAGFIAEKLTKSLKNELNLIIFLVDVASGYYYMGPKYSDFCLNYLWNACELLVKFMWKFQGIGPNVEEINCQIRILFCNIALVYVLCAMRLAEFFFQNDGGATILQPLEIISVFNKCKIFLKGLCAYFDDIQPFSTSGWILWARFPHTFQKNLSEYVRQKRPNWEFVIFNEDINESKRLNINSGAGRVKAHLDSYALTKETVPEALKRICLPYDESVFVQIAMQIRNFRFSFRSLGFNFETSTLFNSTLSAKVLLQQKNKELIEAGREGMKDCEILYLLAYGKKRTNVTLDGLLYIYLRACNVLHTKLIHKSPRSNISCEEMVKMLRIRSSIQIKGIVFAEYSPCNDCMFLKAATEYIKENPEEEISDTAYVRAHHLTILFCLNARRTNKPDQVVISQVDILQKMDELFNRQMTDATDFPQDKYCMLDQYATILYYLGNYKLAKQRYLEGLKLIIEYKYINMPTILNQAKPYIYEALQNSRRVEEPYEIANLSYVFQHNIRDYSKGIGRGAANTEDNYSKIKEKIEEALQNISL